MGRRVFVGVVTHPRSRFHADARRQLDGLVAEARGVGWECTTEISDEDGWDPAAYPVDRSTVLRTAWVQAGLERRWRRYLAAGEDLRGPEGLARSLRDDALFVGTGLTRTGRFLGARPWSAAPDLPGTRAAVRLVNIDLSHLRLMRAGRAQGTDWTVILEDDAREDRDAGGFTGLLERLDAIPDEIQFVNASRSIPLDELGVAPLLAPARDGVRRTTRPVTNTVCAVAYRGSMLQWLPEAIEGQGLLPAVPIDWRLNWAIMEAVTSSRLAMDSCAWLDPAPFVQGSMHEPEQ